MATQEQKMYRDGFISLIGGQDSGTNPALLEPTKASLIVNGMCRGGFLDNRFGYKERGWIFENDEQLEWCEEHLFQGSAFFDPDGQSPMLVFSSGGRIFKVDVLNLFLVSEITPQAGTITVGNFVSPGIGVSKIIAVSDNTAIHIGYPVTIDDGRYLVTAKDTTAGTITIENLDATAGVNVVSGKPVYYLIPNSSLLPRIWTLQAENYLLIQNGSSACIVFDGSTCRRAVRTGEKLEIPTGTAMAYWQGRIWVAVNGNEFEAGNIVDDDIPDSIIQFTEDLYLAEGGRFRVPTQAGNITAMRVLPVLDTSMGQGPLQVYTPTCVFTMNLPVERARWKDVDSPVQTIGIINFGALADWSTVIINGDAWFRAQDGLRSFRLARQEFGSPGNVPHSREMQRIIDGDDEQFLQYGSAVLFKNLLLFTVNPLPVNSGQSAYWRGLGVLDFDLLSSMGQKSPPVYAGLWTGVNVMQVVKGTFRGEERCFMFVRNAEDANELWEIDPNNRFDNDGGRIETVVETREMDYGHPFQIKELETAELWVDSLQGKVEFTLQFRPNWFPCWRPWATKEQCVVARQCTPAECFMFPTLQPGYKTRIGFGQPPDTCENANNMPDRLAYSHAIRLTITGRARVRALLVKARERTEPALAPC